MIRLISRRKTIADLDELTEDQRDNIDRLLMILWKTRPIACSINSNIFEDRQDTDELEEHLCFHFLRASGL